MKQFLTQFLIVAGVTISILCYYVGYNEGWQSRADEYAHKEYVLRQKFDRVAYQNETNKIAAFKLMQEKEKLKENFELAGRLLREADSLKNCVK